MAESVSPSFGEAFAREADKFRDVLARSAASAAPVSFESKPWLYALREAVQDPKLKQRSAARIVKLVFESSSILIAVLEQVHPSERAGLVDWVGQVFGNLFGCLERPFGKRFPSLTIEKRQAAANAKKASRNRT